MNNIRNFENFNNQDIFTYIEKNDIQSVKNYIDSDDVLFVIEVKPENWASWNIPREVIKWLNS